MRRSEAYSSALVALFERILLGRLALAGRLLLGSLQDLVGLHAGVLGAFAALDAVGGLLHALALLGDLALELRHTLDQTGDVLGAVSVVDHDVGGPVAEVARVLLGDVTNALGCRQRVAADRFRFLHRLAAEVVGLGAGLGDDLVGFDPRFDRRDRRLGAGEIDLELLGVRRHRVERCLRAFELLGEQLGAIGGLGRGGLQRVALDDVFVHHCFEA